MRGNSPARSFYINRRRLNTRRWMTSMATLFISGMAITAADAALTIVPSWDASIEALPAADRTKVKNTITSAINLYKTWYADNVTVNITFADMGSGLGASSTQFTNINYANWRTALIGDKTTPDDNTATGTLPNQVNNPVTNTAQVRVSTANQRAIGLAAAIATDSTVSLNTSICTLSRADPVDATKFDLMAVAMHEINEALGWSSSLNLAAGTPPKPADHFRYEYDGLGQPSRSYRTDVDAQSWFSFNGGATALVQYNQRNDGSDFADWFVTSTATGNQGGTVRIQDAYGTKGSRPDMMEELRMLDVIGYDYVPEPSTAMLGLLAAGGVALRRSRRS